jgi:hypothetical protein
MAFAAVMGISSTAFAQQAGDDDEEEGWIEETEEEEAPAPPPPPPKKKKAKKKKKTKVVVVDEAEDGGEPPAWTRGRRGKPKKVIVAREGEPTPPGYHVEYKSRKNIWIPGVVLLSTGYAVSAVSSAIGIAADADCGILYDGGYGYYGGGYDYCGRSRDWGWGFVPLVGPFVIAADDDFEDGWRAGYALMGIAQNLGLGLTIGGAASKRKVWVLNHGYRYRGETSAPYAVGSAETPQPGVPELTFSGSSVTFKTTF